MKPLTGCLLLLWLLVAGSNAVGDARGEEPSEAGAISPSHGALTETNLVAERFEPLSQEELSALETQASAGRADAQYEVGARLVEGFGVEVNSAKGYEWLRKVAEQGEIRAQRRVGDMLLTGMGVSADSKQGLDWLTKAALAGDAQAQLDLGAAYFEGAVVAQNHEKAFPLLLKVAQRGDAGAQRSVGVMYAQGQGVTNDFKAAREWLEKAAAQNEPQALYDLGVLYSRGDGVPRDSKTAFSFFLRSAINGDMAAKLSLVGAYETGAGVAKDEKKMQELLEDAAWSGSAQAQANLARRFSAGAVDGAPDYAKARRWVERAAAQGFAAAEAEMGRMCQEGVGGPVDKVEALKWFYLAAAQGFREAVWRRNEAALFADALQKQEARRRADAFKPAPSRPVSDDDGVAAVCPLGEAFDIPATLFGETKHLVVDTGATTAVLDVTNRARLGEPLARIPIYTSLAIGTELAVYSCPGIRIAGRQFAPLWTVCDDLAKLRMVTGEPFDGILGMSCLKHYVVCFDCDQASFSIGGPVPEKVRKSTLAIPLKPARTSLGVVVEVNINGLGPFRFGLDSGNSGCGSIALNEHDWQVVFAQKTPKTALVTLGGLGNQSHPSQMARLDTVQIGTNRYTNLIAQLVPSSTLPSQLTQTFIRRHILTLDFPNRLLYLAPGKHFADAEEASLSGMLPVEVAGKIGVSSVEQGSPAFRAGIRQDDQIISINGEEASSLGLKPLRQMLQAKPGTELRVVVKRGEETRRFEFVLERPI
jgi:TPR repeat protein